MRTPWNCPYCDLKSDRRANLSVHVERKHKGAYNPFPELKRANPFDAYKRQRPEVMPSKPLPPNSEVPRSSPDGTAVPDIQLVLQHVRLMNRDEIAVLMVEVARRMSNIGFWSNPS